MFDLHKEDSERLVRKLIDIEIQWLNSHLPHQRKTIDELLQEDPPYYVTVRGEHSYISHSDVENVATLLPPELRPHVRFPIVVLRDLSKGEGTLVVSGSDHDRRFVAALLEIPYRGDGELIVYWPEVQKLANLLGGLLCIGFRVSREEPR